MELLKKINIDLITSTLANIRRKRMKLQVGLDLGSHSLKIIEASTDHEKPTLKRLGVYELPPKPTPRSVTEGLTSLLKSTPLENKEVAIAVSGPNVVVRFVELPLMQDSEFLQALPYEAEKHIPFDIKDTILDYAILEKKQAEKKMDALLIGVKKDFVRERMNLVSEAGLVPAIIDIDSIAVYNAFVQSIPHETKDKTVALLNTGASLTSIAIIRKNLPWMIRDISLGCADLIKTLKDQLDVSDEEAQGLVYDPKGKQEEVSSRVNNMFQKLADEVKLSFSYYEDKHGKGVEEIYISGGCAKLEGITKFLKEATTLEVKQWNPLACFRLDSEISGELADKYRSALATRAGLALRR